MTENNKIKLTVEIEAPQWFLDLAQKVAGVEAEVVEEVVKKPAPKVPAKPVAPAKPAVPAKAPAKPAPKKAEAVEEDEGGGFGDEAKTLDDVKAAMGRYAKTFGKPAAMEFLAQYGTNNINKLTEDQYGELCAAADEALEEAGEQAA